MTKDCLFCKIASGVIPADVIAESEGAIAIRDIEPQAPVHVLVIPKSHVPSLLEAEDAWQLGEILSLAVRVAGEQGISRSGFRTVINTGHDGGQSVGHLHVHVLGGRRLSWPPG